MHQSIFNFFSSGSCAIIQHDQIGHVVSSKHMSFTCYERCLSRRSYQLNFKDGVQETEENGKPLDTENLNLPIPAQPNGYDYLFYPLAVMGYLGVKEESILKLLKDRFSLFKLPKNFEMKIYREVLKTASPSNHTSRKASGSFQLSS